MNSTSNSSLLQINSKISIHHTNEHNQKHFAIPPSHHHPSLHQHLTELLTRSDKPKPDQLPFALPLPNFLIDPQDGQFTPYFDRSPASSPGQEYDDPMESNHNSQPSSPLVPISPLRSRATSIALKKLIENQAQRLMDISAAWKKKYPSDDLDFPSDAIHGDKPDPSPRDLVDLDSNHGKPKGGSVDGNRGHGLNFSNLKQKKTNSRHHRSISQKSAKSFSSLIERLSLNDYNTNNKDTMARPPQKSDVENWKREVSESQCRLQMTRDWINLLPLSEEFDEIPDDPELILSSS